MGAKAIFIRIWSGFLIPLYLALFALGIIALVFISVFPQIGVVLMICGILGIFVAVSGCIGAGFQKKQKQTNHHTAFFLIIFFASMFFFHFVLFIFGGVLIALANSIQLLELLPVGRFLKFMETLPDNWKDVDADVADVVLNIARKIRSLVLSVGILLVVFAILHIVTIIVTAFRMGETYVAKFFVVVCSLLDVALGLTLGIVLLCVSYSPSSVFYGQFPTYIVVPLIVFGFVLALVGVIGLLTVCIGVKHKFLPVAFNVGNVIILAGFFFVFIVSIALYRKVVAAAQTFCNDSFCDTWIDNANRNTCPEQYAVGEPCYKEEEMKKGFEVLFRNLANIIIFLCAYFMAFMSLVVFSTGVICRKKDKNSGGGEDARELYNSNGADTTSSSSPSSSSNMNSARTDQSMSASASVSIRASRAVYNASNDNNNGRPPEEEEEADNPYNQSGSAPPSSPPPDEPYNSYNLNNDAPPDDDPYNPGYEAPPGVYN